MNEPLKGEIVLPESFGQDATPTAEMIAAGKHGNGCWDKLSVEQLQQKAAEARAEGKALKEQRRERFAERMNEAIDASADLTISMIEAGKRLMEEQAQGKRLNIGEMQLLKMAQAAAKENVDRDMGKAKAVTETTQNVNLLGLLLDARKTLEP